MVLSRQPRSRPLLRLGAGLCILVWLTATSYCSLEALLGGEGAGRHPDPGAVAAHHAGGAGAQPRSSHHARQPEGDGDFCCSSLHALPADTGALLLGRPQWVAVATLHSPRAERTLILNPPEITPPRWARNREWAFTPAVFLGPALRSLAPPVGVAC
jgi:hypothetical protein